MGIFDKLVDKIFDETGKVMEKAVDKIVEKTGADLSLEGIARRSQAIEYFRRVLSNNINQYEVKENTTIGGVSYIFGIYQEKRLLAVINLLDENMDDKPIYLKAKETVEKEGVAFIDFYLDMPNEEEYIIDKINSSIN